jgi:hypothetical protein
MSQSTKSERGYKATVTLRTVDVVQDYDFRRHPDGAWTFEKVGGAEDGTIYVLRNQSPAGTATYMPPALSCTCKGFTAHKHCKHSDWLKYFGVGLGADQAEQINRVIADGQLQRYNLELAAGRETTLREDLATRWAEVNEIANELTEERARCDELAETLESRTADLDQVRAELETARGMLAEMQQRYEAYAEPAYSRATTEPGATAEALDIAEAKSSRKRRPVRKPRKQRAA